MSDSAYQKCACSRCGEHIEFPTEAAGMVVNCPHCGQPTQLQSAASPVPPAAATPPRVLPRPPAKARGGPQPAMLAVLAVAFVGTIVIVAGGLLLLRRPHATAPAPSPASPVQPAHAPDPSPPPATPAPAPPPTPPAVKAPKSPDDFKVGEVKLDKTPGSSLVYAVGTLTNDSEYQRFGVRIKLDLLNADGGHVGTAQDYKEILEPHKTWQFRALIINSKPASARLAGVTEEP